jgi:hypothetical protein
MMAHVDLVTSVSHGFAYILAPLLSTFISGGRLLRTPSHFPPKKENTYQMHKVAVGGEGRLILRIYQRGLLVRDGYQEMQ